MKKFVLSLALIFGLVSATTQKSHAIVGAVISAPAAVSAGGVMVLAGAMGFALPIAVNNSDFLEDMISNSEAAYTTLLVSYIVSIPAMLLGVVVLDGDQQGEIAFTKIVNTKNYSQFTKEEIATYNRELSKLNAIQQTITTKVAQNAKTDVDAQWETLGAKLSPATIEIAALHAAEMLKEVKVK